MTTPFVPDPGSGMNRRDIFKTALAAAGGAALGNAPTARAAAVDARKASPKRYAMKKSINLWAFPYPERMTLTECLQLAKDAGFDGIELNYDLGKRSFAEERAAGVCENPQGGRAHWDCHQRGVLVFYSGRIR